MRRYHCILRAAAVVLLAIIGISVVSGLTADQNRVSSIRQLRYHVATQEERGITSRLKATASQFVDAVKLRSWLSKEKSVDDIFSKLKLNSKLDDALGSPDMRTLNSYVDLFNKKYPDKQVSLIGTLKTHYGDYAVAEAIMSAQGGLAKERAGMFQFFQLKDWFGKGKSVDDLFSILKVTDDGPKALMSWKLDTLDDYTRYFNIKSPEHKTSVFKVLRRGFGGDDQFAIVVSKAMDISETQKNAAIFQEKLFKQWVKSDIYPDDALTKVFKIPKDKLATVGTREKSIVSEYRKYYVEDLGLDQIPSGVIPRRG
ncbi:hypothetical protein V7S43_011188 [Phytophthora oleae]|uniref:RxLR effector protein n=1 Tax=Phytophthora oleae TaxID=2107226 RepID=A0ABD3FAG7_9STRA